MHLTSSLLTRRIALVAGASLLTACADSTAPSPVAPARAPLAALSPTSPFAPAPGTVKVCNFSIVSFTSYPRANYIASATGGNLQHSAFSVGLPEECLVIWSATDETQQTVTVTQQTSPDYALDRIVLWYSNNLETDQVITGRNTVTVNVSGSVGAALWFKNGVAVTPPPPQGGQGCTPGYWKQSQHFDSWTAPYTPSTPFGSVFADAFPGKTLLQVAGLGGGGLNALGRHTVAALLNSASGGVDYDMSTAAVIAAFNAAYVSGDATTIERTKDSLAAFNEQGCPLN